MALTPQIPTAPIDNANSYLSLVDARALAEQYAYDLPTDDAEAEKALIKGFRYIETFEPSMCGTRTTEIQNSSYPRTGVTIRCKPFPDDEFPKELLVAQVIAAQYQGSGTDLSGGANDGRSIASEQAGKVSISYFDNGKTGSSVTIAEFDSAIDPILCKASNGINFTVGRA
ncbi:putative head completion adaptor [Vibrio phage 242E40-1]|nr:putative head completion adaptor [Vibrio phage 242E40-1]